MQVGEALAGARARLRDEVLARRERALDRRRERSLLGPRLEAGERRRQAPAGPKCVHCTSGAYASEWIGLAATESLARCETFRPGGH